MTRAAVAAAPLVDTQPTAVTSQEQQRQALQAICEEQEMGSGAAEPEAVQPVKLRGGRHRTQAVIASAVQADASSPALAPAVEPVQQVQHVQKSDQEQDEPAGGCGEPALPTACTEQPAAAPEDKPRRRGRCVRDYGVAVGGVPASSRTSPITLAHMPRLHAPPPYQSVAVRGSQCPCMCCVCRPSRNKENAEEGPAPASKLGAISEGGAASQCSACPQQLEQQPAGGDGGGKRRKRLLPSAPLSSEMRLALGELEDVSLRQQMAQKQLAAAAASNPEAAGKRSRRQTKFFRL